MIQIPPPKLQSFVFCFILIFIRFEEKRYSTMKKNQKIIFEKNKNMGDQKTGGRHNRFLITVNIMGSSGPIRFVVNEKELVSGVIETTLKSYAREGRLPVLGFDATNFLLYHPNAGFDALNPMEPIGSYEARNFVLCKKLVFKKISQSELISPKSKKGGWKAWLNKSFSFKIISH